MSHQKSEQSVLRKRRIYFFPLFQISVRFHWGNHYRLNRTFWWDGLHYTKEQKRRFSVESYILYYSELRFSKTISSGLAGQANDTGFLEIFLGISGGSD